MTRKELSIEIAKAQASKMNLGIESVRRIAKGLLNGSGYAKPMEKAELVKWYNNLVADGFIAA